MLCQARWNLLHLLPRQHLLPRLHSRQLLNLMNMLDMLLRCTHSNLEVLLLQLLLLLLLLHVRYLLLEMFNLCVARLQFLLT